MKSTQGLQTASTYILILSFLNNVKTNKPIQLLEGFIVSNLVCVILILYSYSTIIQCYHHNYFVGIMSLVYRRVLCTFGKKGTCKATFGFSMHLMTEERMRELEKEK